MANLSVDFLGKKFNNPTILASGILGVTSSSLKRVVKAGAGGVTSKSIWLEEHKGHPNPVVLANEHFMINAVGLPDAGIEKAKEELGDYLKWKDRAPLIASIVAKSKMDFGEITDKITEIGPDFIEVNISCPNVEDEFGRPFAASETDTFEVTSYVKKRTKIPVIVKLSPNVENISKIAKAAADGGADAICAVNTFGPGMVIDIDTAEPVLANKVGGVSGPGIKPLAVKAVYDISKNCKLPIIGMGGLMTGRDAIEMMMAGASLVGFGAAVYYRDVAVFGEVVKEMNEWCDKNGVKNISEIIGRANVCMVKK
jgi:dihydroorotate dehydrogenase (NAD+) catalytic subunit